MHALDISYSKVEVFFFFFFFFVNLCSNVFSSPLLSGVLGVKSAIQDFATSGSDNATKGLCRAISTTTSQARSKNAPHGVSFLMLASPTYRPWSRGEAC